MDDMTRPIRTEADQSHMMKKILDLAMEIIYLVTGEGYEITKKAQQFSRHAMSITVSPPCSPKPEMKHKKQKILEVTQKMMVLLTGEVPIRCQDVTVYFSMEEWEYLEGHKELYKDVMMASQPVLTSPDGSSNGSPPETCPRPLYSRDPTQEDLTIPHHHQHTEPIDVKVEIKEESEEEEEMYVSVDHQPTPEELGVTVFVKEEEDYVDINTEMSKRKCGVIDFFFSKAAANQSQAASASCSCRDDPSSYAETKSVTKADSVGDSAADVSERTPLPECWDLNHWLEYKQKYPWMFVENGFLGCDVCREVKRLGASVSQSIYVSKEWSSGTITQYGKTKKEMLTSLRKKIHIHKLSEAHVKASDILAVSRRKILQTHMEEQHKLASTTKVFRTAYFCAEKCRPFADFQDLLGLQVANGADLLCVLHSERKAAQIVDCVAGEMRRKLCKAIVEQAAKMSVYVDESTTHSVFMVYLRASVNGEEPLTFFLDLLDLPKGDLRTVDVALVACLAKHGFGHDFLAENLIGVCSDGASAELGRTSGFLERLNKKYPQLVKWHCLCHRLEACVSDTLDSIPGLHHVTSFFENLFAACHQSPKNLFDLSECSKELESQILQIGKVSSIRRVACSQKAVQAVWEAYPALHRHFAKASLSSAHNVHRKSLFGGLHKLLTSEDYLLNLAMVADSVQEVGLLSDALRRHDITLVRACQLIHRSVRAMEKLKDMRGKHQREAMESLERGNFKGVTIKVETRGQVRANFPHFYQCLVDNLRSRLYTPNANRGPQTSPPDDFATLVSEIDILDSHRWPTNVDSPWFEGEEKLEQLCKRFRLDYPSICEAFRDFIDNGGTAVPESLKPLMTAVNSLPVTSGDCGRGFGAMNLMMSPIRSRLGVKRESSRLFVSLVGPPVQLWDPLPYVVKWLNARADEATS